MTMTTRMSVKTRATLTKKRATMMTTLPTHRVADGQGGNEDEDNEEASER
jgi:hypothetical protein